MTQSRSDILTVKLFYDSNGPSVCQPVHEM